MTGNNSYLIPVEKLVKASQGGGHQWAQPVLHGIQLAMRSVFENKREVPELLTDCEVTGNGSWKECSARYSEQL